MKLAAAAVLIVAAGLVIAGATGMGVARSYLIRQADSQLKAYSDALVNGVITIMPSGVVRSGFGPGPFGESGPAVEVFSPDGKLLTPVGKRPIPVSTEPLPLTSAHPVSVPAGNGRTTWRVISERIHYRASHIPFVYGSQDTSVSVTSPAKPGLPGVLVVGIRPGGVDSAVGSITAAVLVVAVVALVFVGSAVVLLTRWSLRPLAEIERTAGALADGEPWRPVRGRDPGGEAGSLARSLNTTLAQTERSLSASAASAAASQQSAELMRQALTDACLQARTPLRVIHGLAVSWRRRGAAPPGEADRVMKRVDEEAARIARLADHLARHGSPPRDPPEPGP